MRRSRLPYLLLLAPLLAGAAPSNAVKQTWLPASPNHWQGTVMSGVTLSMKDGSKKHIPGKVMETVLTVKTELESASGQRAELALVDTDRPNAYATVHGSRPIIALSLSYLDRFGSDRHALAATLGHELAHLHLGHSAAARHADGVVSTRGISGAGASEGSSRSRHEEREADRLGLEWSSAAGFDPCGQARLLQAMSHDLPALSTHPAYAERIEAALAAAQRINGRRCD